MEKFLISAENYCDRYHDGCKSNGQKIGQFWIKKITLIFQKFTSVNVNSRQIQFLNLITSYPKVTTIIRMRKAKNASSFRSPYLSRRRKVNVSAIVISTPAYSGIL